MMSLALAGLTCLLLAAASVAVAVIRRPKPLYAVAFAVPVLVLLLWLASRSAAPSALPIAGWQWTGGQTTWALSGVLLLLLLIAVVQAIASRAPDVAPNRPLSVAFALSAATLPVLLAGDARTQVAGVALFAVALSVTGQQRRAWLWPAAASLLLWGAAVSGDFGVWLALAAAGVLLGVWPVDRWRSEAIAADAPGLLAWGAPVLAGSAVLDSVVRSGQVVGLPLAAATAVGLLSLLAGLARLRERSPSAYAAALSPALAGLGLVAGIWAGEAALLPATRVAVLAPVSLLLLPAASGLLRGRWPRLLPAAIIYAAVAGLPLTAGFAAWSRLYAAWPAPGGLVLAGAIAALLTLWLAGLYLVAAPDETGSSSSPGWLQALPAALAAAGLLGFDPAVRETPPLVWAALVAPAAAGALLARFAPGLRDLPVLLREAPPPRLTYERLLAPARRATAALAAAADDAANILEGRAGLILVLALIALFLWIGS